MKCGDREPDPGVQEIRGAGNSPFEVLHRLAGVPSLEGEGASGEACARIVAYGLQVSGRGVGLARRLQVGAQAELHGGAAWTERKGILEDVIRRTGSLAMRCEAG